MSEARKYLSLRELQLVNLELLLEFDVICETFDIRYSLCGGTMLGAARHQGFIPWDDDVDLMMLRCDYERFLELAPAINQISPLRQVVSNRDNTFARDYARFVRKDYGKDEEDIVDADCPWVGLDIFPIDDISDNQEEFEKQVRDRVFWHEVFVTCSAPRGAGSTRFKRVMRDAFRPFAFAIGRFRAARKSEAICRRFDGCGGADIAIVCGMYGTKERWPKACYAPLGTLPFEGHDLPVPRDYDTYMKAIYGEDYMQLPPEDKRKPPHIKAWKL
ncbi:MAG: LicD family protein [Eggerthellaceae bacterium]|nr:LicD family protein [Eggerthellaceae bacterium]